MGTAKLMSLGRIEGCVNASEHHVGTAVARHFPNFIAAQRIGRVDPDTDNIAGLNASGIHSSQRFIDKRGIAEGFGSCRRKHVQPTRRDYRGPERDFAGINEMNAHTISPFLGGPRHRRGGDITRVWRLVFVCRCCGATWYRLPALPTFASFVSPSYSNVSQKMLSNSYDKIQTNYVSAGCRVNALEEIP